MTAGNPVAYPPRTNLDSARYWLHEQRIWMQQCGGNAAGYQAHYAGHYPPEQIQTIYDADLGVLHHYEQRVSDLEARARKRARR